MRYFVVKELNNNLYLGTTGIASTLHEAMFYDDLDLALECSEKERALNAFLFRALEETYGMDVWHLDISQEMYDREKGRLNVRVIPVEIHEGTYYE